MMTKLLKQLWLMAMVVALASLSAEAGQRGARGLNGPGGDGSVAPAEIQRLFDAYALVQAQNQLQLSDQLYPQFLARFKALQDARRQTALDHARLVLQLRRLLMDPQSDESQLKSQIEALQQADDRGAADIRKAYEAVDQVLDVRQQARFRVFEEQMERRKLELVTRARQAIRPRQQQQP